MVDIMAQLNISVPDALKGWIDTRLAQGRFSSPSDYVRDLVRRDQDSADDETEWLRGLIAEGLASGVVEKDASEVLHEVMAENRARRRD